MAHTVAVINGMTNAQDDDLMHFVNDLLDGNSCVVGANDYKVSESSPVAMSVDVATGKAYNYISSKNTYYRTYLDAATTLTIDSNISGSTRIDIICIKIDTAITPDANATNVATLVAVKGTPGAGVPATPANHYKLAEVTVANGAVSIINANIADKRVRLPIRVTRIADDNGNEVLTFVKTASAVNEVEITNAATNNPPQIAPSGGDTNIDLLLKGKGAGMPKLNANYGDWVDDTDGATITFDMSLGARHRVTLGGNRTLAVTNVKVGQAFFLRLKQDATGNRTVTWWSGITWLTSGGTAPTLQTAANKVDLIGFICTGSGTYDGFSIAAGG